MISKLNIIENIIFKSNHNLILSKDKSKIQDKI